MGSPRQKRVAAIIILSALLLTALFLAQGSTELVASWIFNVDRPEFAARTTKAPPGADSQRRRDDTQILRRNIFDSETGPLDGTLVSDVEEALEDEPVEFDPNAEPPVCEGSIRLVAAIVNPRRPAWSFAAIIDATGKAMLYRSGMEVSGKQIVAIRSSRVIMRPGTGAPCQITMFAPPPTAGKTPVKVARATKSAKQKRANPRQREGAISTADMEGGITRVSDSNFNIQRSLVDRILANQAELMRTARIIPHEEGGRVIGVKMYGIRRNSLLGRLGMQNGDMLRTINGFDMASPDSALEAYATLRGADHLSMQVVRRGSAMTIDYNIQ